MLSKLFNFLKLKPLTPPPAPAPVVEAPAPAPVVEVPKVEKVVEENKPVVFPTSQPVEKKPAKPRGNYKGNKPRNNTGTKPAVINTKAGTKPKPRKK